jgi:uncharacterized membrane protein
MGSTQEDVMILVILIAVAAIAAIVAAHTVLIATFWMVAALPLLARRIYKELYGVYQRISDHVWIRA